MTEVNPTLACYRRGRARAFEERGDRIKGMLQSLPDEIAGLVGIGASGSDRSAADAPDTARAGVPELIYNGGKTGQTLVYRAGERVCKVALTPEAAERLRNEYELLGGPFEGYEMFPEVFALANVEDRRVGGTHLALGERFIGGADILAHVERRRKEGWPLSTDELLSLIFGMFDAMAVVHRAGYVHRDPHPGNWIVTPEGKVRLIDFGLCASVGECAGALRGERVLSRGYEAPEVRNAGRASCASDVCSIGKVIAKAVYGTRDARALPRGVPLTRFLRRCMAGDPSKRFSDAYEARLALMGRWAQ